MTAVTVSVDALLPAAASEVSSAQELPSTTLAVQQQQQQQQKEEAEEAERALATAELRARVDSADQLIIRREFELRQAHDALQDREQLGCHRLE